jgi:hypothetical protein
MLSVGNRLLSGFMPFEPTCRASSPGDLANAAVHQTSIPKVSKAPGTPITTTAFRETTVELGKALSNPSGFSENPLKISFEGLDDIMKIQAPSPEAARGDESIEDSDSDEDDVEIEKGVLVESGGKED